MPRSRKPKPLNPEEWVHSSKLMAVLNIRKRKLAQLRNDGVFVNGVHWLDINPFATPRYRYHLQRCQERLIQLRREETNYG